MKLTLVTLCGLLAEARDVRTASIDCTSGVPDLTSGVKDVTQDECRTQCESQCASQVTNSDELEKCLTNESIKGCLFQVSSAQEHDVNYCLHQPTNGDESSQLVVKIRGEDLYVTGQTASAVEKNNVKVGDVVLALEVKDVTMFQSCANKNVKIGINTVSFDDKTCPSEATLSIKNAFTVGANKEDNLLMISIGDALKGLWGQKDDASVVIQLEDASCGKLEVDDAQAFFSISYQSGYIDTSSCREIQDCLQCKVAGCHWCSWSRTADAMLPDWLPDWDWVDSAKLKAKGECGLNSAVCKLSTGEYDVCGANAVVGSAVLAAAAAAGVAFWG